MPLEITFIPYSLPDGWEASKQRLSAPTPGETAVQVGEIVRLLGETTGRAVLAQCASDDSRSFVFYELVGGNTKTVTLKPGDPYFALYRVCPSDRWQQGKGSASCGTVRFQHVTSGESKGDESGDREVSPSGDPDPDLIESAPVPVAAESN